jgi:predicted permease
MIKNYLKIAWRNLIRHKGYSFINIAGLAVGVAACLLIFLIVQYELSFDTFQPDVKNTYHIVSKMINEDGFAYTPGVPIPALDALRLDFPQAKVAGLDISYGSQITVQELPGTNTGDKKIIENTGVTFIEPQFFDIFKSKWLAGNKSVLADPHMVVIDKSSAIKYFGSWQTAMGKSLKMDNIVNLKVAGIIEDAPSNTDFPFKVMISYITFKEYPREYNYSKEWGMLSSSHNVFMQFPDKTSQASIDARLKDFTAKHFRTGLKNHLLFTQPLAMYHFDTRFNNVTGDHVTSMTTIRTWLFIAALIILMAAINFVNLSTAQSVRRSKEVGIRKVLGSDRKQLIFQIMGETTLIVVIAAVAGIGLAWLGMPYLANIASVPKDLSLLNGGSLLFLLVVTIAVVLLSGVYPAFIVSGFKPVLAIKNKITASSGSGIPLRRVLVVVQFAISQLLIIGTIVAVNQMDFVNKADLGFNKEALLIINGPSDSVSLNKMAAYRHALLQKPAVKSVTFDSDQPSSDNNWGRNFQFNNSTKDNNLQTFIKYGDAAYFKTYGLHFLAGHGYDQGDTARQVVVNETFLRKVNILRPNEAIGKTVRIGGDGPWMPIVGVLKDFKTNSLRESIRPIVILQSKRFESNVAIKLETKNLSSTVAALQKQWEQTYPEYAYNGYFLDDNIAKFYKQENQLALLCKIFAGIAIFISCLGLYGLVSFMAVQRNKEVGIRKVLGASVSSIVLLFSKEFILLIVISFAIAMPLSWYLMSGWLQNFAYRIDLGVGVFLLAMLSSIAIAWLTVGYKAVMAAVANPVKSLRSE